MIKTHKWTINGILMIIGILGMAFFFSHDYDLPLLFNVKWMMIVTVSIILFNFLGSIIKLYRMHSDLTLYQHIQLFFSPVLFIIIAWYSLTKHDPILGLVLLGLNGLSSLFTNSVYKQLIYNEDKFYYNRRIVEYDHVINFEVSDDFLSLDVESSFLFFKLQDDIHIEKTEKNQEVFESIVSTLLSEHRHKQSFVS